MISVDDLCCCPVSSQVNISLVVNDNEAKQAVAALHEAFFEDGFSAEIQSDDDQSQNGSAVPPYN